MAEASNPSPAQAAALADSALAEAATVLREAFGHPHHSPRLDQIESILSTVRGLVADLPREEESRADHAGRLLEQYRSRSLPAALSSHADDLLRQELERAGQS